MNQKKHWNLRIQRGARSREMEKFSPSAKVSEWLDEINKNFEMMVYGLYDLDGNSSAPPYNYTNNMAHQIVIDEDTGQIYRCKWFIKKKNWSMPPRREDGRWIKTKSSEH